MTPQLIKARIKTVLAADSDLTAYPVKKIFEGIRNSVSDDDYPLIVIEPGNNDEGSRRDINGTIDNELNFIITGILKEYDADSQLDLIFDLENKIKKALSQDVQLNSNALNSRFGRTEYSAEFWPIRGVIIPFNVEYRQNYKLRT